MLSPIPGTRDPAVKKNMKTLMESVFLAAVSCAQPSQHPEPVHLPEPHTEQAVALCFVVGMQGPESRVDLLATH